MRTLGALIFDDFELLDLYGPLEMFGMLRRVGGLEDEMQIRLVAEQAHEIASSAGPKSLADELFGDDKDYDILLIPGGMGARREVKNDTLLDWLGRKSDAADVIATVCTGSAILARTGRLDGRAATSNKAAFKWVADQGPKVDWRAKARWVEDGKFFTSSGVSAGMDMAMALIERLYGEEAARIVAQYAEYTWAEDPADDPFWALYDLS